MPDDSLSAASDLPREVRDHPILSVSDDSAAFNVFDSNMMHLEAALCLAFSHESFRLHDTPRSQFFLQSRIDCIQNDLSGPWSVDVRYSMLKVQVVMLVTAVEVYLKEILTTLAMFDPGLMTERESNQEWNYSDIHDASDRDTVLREFCYRWARNKIDGGGGPARWVEWLRGLGVQALAANEIVELEALWGLRHLYVHSGRTITPEFARRHPSLAETLLTRGIALEDVLRWRATCESFVYTVEKAVVGRLRSRRNEEIVAGQERAIQAMMTTLDKNHKRMLEVETDLEREARIERTMAAANERFWRMGFSREGDVPIYPGEP